MLYNENLHEEEQHLIQQIAEQTERGKIGWELTEYNPLSFLNEDKIDKNPAVICQSFSFEAIIGGSRFELDVMENIDVPSGMGDYTITVADGLFCREIDGLFCRSSPDIIVRRRCVLSHKRRGWLQPSPSFRYSRNLALQDELYHPVINNGPAVLVCVDKRLGTGPVNQSRDAG